MNVELKKIKRTVYVVGLVVLICVGGLLWFLMHSFITIAVAPRNATVTVDDKQIRVTGGEANINTAIGDHEVKIEAEGYVGYNQTLNFKRGFNKKIEVSLSEVPAPVKISNDAKFLAKGSDFSDGYYLSNKTLFKAKIGTDDNGVVSVLENRAITDSKVTDIEEIIWSPTKELALFRKSDSVTLFDFMKYDFVNQTETPWASSDVGSIAWAPDKSKIAYSYSPATGERSLIFANTTNTNVERVANFVELGIDNPLLRWSPDSQWLLIIPRNAFSGDNKIYLFNAYSRKIKELTDIGDQIDANFSPDGNKILYSTYSAERGNPTSTKLFLMDITGNNKRDLSLRANLDQTVWTKDSINIVVATTDGDSGNASIFRFDTEKKEKSGFSVNNLGAIDIKALAFSDDGKLLLYEENNQIFALKVN